MFQKESGHWTMWTWDNPSIPRTNALKRRPSVAHGKPSPWVLPYLSSLGSNTNFTSLTMVGKYFSAAPCKPRTKKNVEPKAVGKSSYEVVITLKNHTHTKKTEITFLMRSWWLNTTKTEGKTPSLWPTNSGDVSAWISWHIITVIWAGANIQCLPTNAYTGLSFYVIFPFTQRKS